MTKHLFFIVVFFLNGSFCAAEVPNTETSTRSFQFNYGATLDNVPAGSKVRIWIPIATNNEHQTVEFLGAVVPTPLQINKDPKYGNSIGYLETTMEKSGKLEFTTSYNVVRREAKLHGAKDALTEQEKKLFLSANSLVPIDGQPLELIKETQLPADPLAASRLIYDVVENYMNYDKSKPGYGNGDSVWACNSKTGNCTDFHSLFISLARSRAIPARFEIGFPLSPDKQEGTVRGYHCWAWFHAMGKGWAPVDISEADKNPEMKDYYFGRLTADRVAFSTGRDIELVPASNSGPLNYFIYPHIEVDGKPWPREKVMLNFSFKNNSPVF